MVGLSQSLAHVGINRYACVSAIAPTVNDNNHLHIPITLQALTSPTNLSTGYLTVAQSANDLQVEADRVALVIRLGISCEAQPTVAPSDQGH